MRVDEPILAVVVITRNEARHISTCLESIVQLVAAFPGSPVVVVDSDSSDDTVAIATRYPVTVFRYRAPVLTAAAGRRIGFEKVRARYVLFVDGDCCLEADWVKSAVALMEEAPKLAVISGRRREVFKEEVTTARSDVGPLLDDYGIGGNAVYRSHVLHEVGGFNPFLPALEEFELLGRIQTAGYRTIKTSEIMFTHYTFPRESLSLLLHFFRRGRTKAVGQVLRLSLKQGQFVAYAHRFNRYLLMLAYLVGGAMLGIFGGPSGLAAWVLIGSVSFLWLVFRRRSLNSATYLVVVWLTDAVGIVCAFLRPLPPPESFAPRVERISCIAAFRSPEVVEIWDQPRG